MERVNRTAIIESFRGSRNLLVLSVQETRFPRAKHVLSNVEGYARHAKEDCCHFDQREKSFLDPSRSLGITSHGSSLGGLCELCARYSGVGLRLYCAGTSFENIGANRFSVVAWMQRSGIQDGGAGRDTVQSESESRTRITLCSIRATGAGLRNRHFHPLWATVCS